jgi:hypothetical protein
MQRPKRNNYQLSIVNYQLKGAKKNLQVFL